MLAVSKSVKGNWVKNKFEKKVSSNDALFSSLPKFAEKCSPPLSMFRDVERKFFHMDYTMLRRSFDRAPSQGDVKRSLRAVLI